MSKKNLILLFVLIIIGSVAFWMYQRNHASSIAENEFTQFAITDTAQIQKKFILLLVWKVMTIIAAELAFQLKKDLMAQQSR